APSLSVVINEWMADNFSTVADPADNDFEDWFELYNSGNSAVDLYDYYLGDSITNRDQYHITDHYVIPSHGFLLVWADNETSQNSTNRPDLHVNFKLAKEGEGIGLFARDGTVIDFVSFGAQTTDMSMGRYPDGGSLISFLPNATPRTANSVPNSPPQLLPIADQVLVLGQTLLFTAVASDSDQPPQTLTFGLAPGAPAGAAMDPFNGHFSWTPSIAPATNQISITVSDNGQPSMS